MTTSSGRFVWFEYVTKDAPKAQGFFGELFGWSTKSVPMPDGAYVMIAAADGRTIGGYSDAPKGAGNTWIPYLRVESASEAAAQVKALGGTVVKPPGKVGDFATMALVADPHGAELALWQPAKPEDVPAPGVGHFAWTELSSKDPAASVAFYTQLGGFTSKAVEMSGMGAYHRLESDGQPRAGILAQRMPQAPHAWLPYVTVASADHTAEKAVKLGGQIIVPPTAIPGVGRFAILLDPQGGATGILQP